jgi:diguanylate cyclase (GGDEF)-like protein/PAS domain S-box-containing protein
MEMDSPSNNWLNGWRYVALTALLFYLAGWLTFQLTGHNFATDVWPTAGIGLGAVLLWGYTVLPGIYLADLLLHYQMFAKASTSLAQLIFFLAPLTSVLQAWLGCVLVKRFAVFPDELVSLRAILLFFFLSGPLATFMPTAFTVKTLLVTENIPEKDTLFTFLSQWFTDCSGIAIFTPLFFIAFNKSHRIWRERLFSLGIPVAVMFSVIVAGYLFSQAKEAERLNKLINNQTESVKTGLQDEFLNHLAILEHYTKIMDAGSLNETSFQLNAQADLKQNLDINQIEWLKATKINQDYRFVRQYVETNQNSGLVDVNAIPGMLNKLSSKQIAITSLGNQQYLIAVPSYETGINTCDCIKGVIVGVFGIKEFLHGAIRSGNYKELNVELSDTINKPTPEPVFGANGDESLCYLPFLNLTRVENVNLGGQFLSLQVMPNKNFLTEYYSWSPWQLLAGGMFLTGFMSIGLLMLTGNTELVAAKVDERTQELNLSNRKLAAREQQFRKLVQTQSAIVWKADPVTFRFVFVSDEAVSILGYPTRQWREETDFWQNHIHEDDKENVLKFYARNVATKNNSYDLEYRMISAEGHVVWLRDVATLVVEEGIVKELYGFMIDITRLKDTEEQLRLAASTFESQQGIMITDKDANILRVNKAFTNITGYSAQQIMGKNPRILKSGRHDQAFYQNYWQQLLIRDKFEGEVWNKRRNGEIYPEWQIVTAVRNNEGEVSHYVSVFSDITEKKDAENKIHNMAFYDALTNLPNRRLLLDRFDQEIASARRHRTYGAVLYLDLDHFKVLNDSQGHLVGDELLIQVAARLSSVLREEDTPARLGGDEFVVLLHANAESLAAAADHAMVVAEKIREQLNTPFILGKYQHQIGTSIGIALFPEGQEHPDVVLQQADTAMYRSKASGRNAISFFQPSMQETADLRLRLEQDLRMAIDQENFILCYHPQMDAEGNLLGAEALIRWEDKIKGRLSPAEFMPVAEESNLILTIGKWVLTEACRQIKEWEDAGLATIPYLSVNVSSRQFRQQDFVNQVKNAIESAGIAPHRLGIELTESVMIVDTQDTIDKMAALKALGLSIAVDDFGTGYSSLVHLKQLPLDVLKIDRAFVRDILIDASDAVIVETIISMAKHFNIRVIAEGVETSAQLAFLKQKGCAIFQGYYFSEPLTADKFAESYLRKIS